jgi:hypothetical protein
VLASTLSQDTELSSTDHCLEDLLNFSDSYQFTPFYEKLWTIETVKINGFYLLFGVYM